MSSLLRNLRPWGFPGCDQGLFENGHGWPVVPFLLRRDFTAGAPDRICPAEFRTATYNSAAHDSGERLPQYGLVCLIRGRGKCRDDAAVEKSDVPSKCGLVVRRDYLARLEASADIALFGNGWHRCDRMPKASRRISHRFEGVWLHRTKCTAPMPASRGRTAFQEARIADLLPTSSRGYAISPPAVLSRRANTWPSAKHNVLGLRLVDGRRAVRKGERAEATGPMRPVSLSRRAFRPPWPLRAP